MRRHGRLATFTGSWRGVFGTEADERHATLARDCGQNAEGKGECDRSLEIPDGNPSDRRDGLPKQYDFAAEDYALVINVNIESG